jgi:predicted acetyltransferase
MNNFIFQADYSTDTIKREELYSLFKRVFNIDVDTFKDFYDRGFWNPTYRPFTYMNGSRAIANTSFFSLDVILREQVKKAAGIQSVMTDPDYRKKGLMTKLMHRMLGEIDQEFDFSLLMTNSPNLYIPFGFRVLREHYFVAPFSNRVTDTISKMRKLEPFTDANDLYLIKNTFNNRSLLSNDFMPVSYQSYFFLNMYDSCYLEKLYLMEDLDAIVVFEVKEKTLKLYDVLAVELPTIEDICTRVPSSIEKVEIHFCPDRFTTLQFKPVLLESQDVLMVRGPFSIEGEYFRFPITANF